MFSTSGGWEFSSKRGRGVTGKKKTKMAPGKKEPRSGSKNIAASGIFGRETALRAFYKLMGGRRMDINDKRSVSTRTFLHSQAGQECRIWV